MAAKMRPEGRIPVKTVLRPQAPCPADVVGQRHRNQHDKREEPGDDRQLDQLRLIFDVHEKQNDDHCLGTSNPKGDDGVEESHVYFRRDNGKDSANQQGAKDHAILKRRDDVMLVMLRVHYIRWVMILGHNFLFPPRLLAALPAKQDAD